MVKLHELERVNQLREDLDWIRKTGNFRFGFDVTERENNSCGPCWIRKERKEFGDELVADLTRVVGAFVLIHRAKTEQRILAELQAMGVDITPEPPFFETVNPANFKPFTIVRLEKDVPF